MICKEGSIDVISIGGNIGGGAGSAGHGNSGSQHVNGGSVTAITNGHNTLQNRRKSQLITFSASSCDIKNSLSHEIILVQNVNSNNCGSGGGGGARNSIAGSSSIAEGGGAAVNSTNVGASVRLSFAEEDILIVTNGSGGSGAGSASVSGGSGSGGSGHGDVELMLDDDVFRRRSLEVDEELFDDEYETHIETLNNANDDSGGGSYEDSHAMHSSIGGSNRNSLEKDDDDIDVDVISTDVSCYDQLLGSSCNTRNDDDDIATLVGDGDNYTKLCKNGGVKATGLKGSSVGSGGVGENGGIIYANPFMDDEGIAESGM